MSVIDQPFEAVDETTDAVVDILRDRGVAIDGEVTLDETPDETVDPVEPETETGTDDEIEPVEVPTETPAPSQVDAWDFDGERLSRDELERMVGFQRALQSNPAVFQAVSQAIDQALSPVPVQTPLPEGFDPDDPMVQWTQSQLAAMQARLDVADQLSQQLAEQQQLQNQATVTSLIGRAKSSFAKQHGLEAGEVDRLYEIAEQTVNIPALVTATVNPLDGKPQRPDPLSALETALTLAYNAIPAYRQKEFARLAEQQTKNAERKAKLSALGGQKGTTPQQPEAPSDPRMHAIAIAREFMSDGLSVQP